jgi:hypothetical protein
MKKSNRKTSFFHIRVQPWLSKQVIQECLIKNISVSEFFRDAAMEKIERDTLNSLTSVYKKNKKIKK